jgi:hypothetical protein
MDCYRHPGTAAAATCVACAQPICPECREEIAGHPMCRPCVADAQARLSQEGEPEAQGATAAEPLAPPAAASPETRVPAAPAIEPLVPASPAPAYAAAAGIPLASPVSKPALGFDGVPPGLVRRVLRGMGWGILYGQWWTVWTIISLFIWGDGSFSLRMVVEVVIMMVIFGFFGSITGLLIGAANASESTGTGIGVGMGVLLCLMEVLLSRSAGGLVNLIFYFFTGRYVGRGITGRVQQLLPSKSCPSGGAAM